MSSLRFEQTAEHEHRVKYDKYIHERLRNYCDRTGEDYSEIKTYFRESADPYNMKSPYDAGNEYYKQLDKFLIEEGH